MENGEIIRTRQIAAIEAEMKRSRAVFFCAHTGWGKTVFIKQYFRKTNQIYRYLSCGSEDFGQRLEQAIKDKSENIVVDDFEMLTADEDKITEIISKGKAKLYILSCCAMPPFLKPLFLREQISEFGYDFFALTPIEIKEIFAAHGKMITTSAAEDVQRATMGWFFVVLALLPRYYIGCGAAEVMKQMLPDLYDYADMNKFNGLSVQVQEFLLKMGHVPEFSEEDARLISGLEEVKSSLDEILKNGSFMTFVPPDKYRFHSFFTGYMIWKQNKECSREFLKRLYERTAQCYDLRGDKINALEYYSRAGNTERICGILTENAKNHPGEGMFYEMREYYLSLPEDVIQASPTLLCAVSMLYSILAKPQKSEEYYMKLKRIADDESSVERERAREELWYLDITLPHRGIDGMSDAFEGLAPVIKERGAALKRISITGNMPSMINGGKDLCEWCKNDRVMFTTMKNSMMEVLGDYYSGFAEIALGESLFEKNFGQSYAEEIILLNAGQYEAETHGNIQLWFASVAVNARIYAALGKLNTAVETVRKFRERLNPDEPIIADIDAFLVQLSMLGGDTESVNSWLSQNAPDENEDFCTTKRYRYLTKIKVYIVKEMYSEALALLSRVDRYFCGYERTYCHIEALILEAVILYRLGDTAWRGVMCDALKTCGEYRFIRVAAKYGVTVLNMIQETRVGIDPEFRKILLETTREYAIMYPKYMKPKKRKDYDFTKSEMTVLKLVCDGLTNEEISDIAGISLRTVKFHLGNIYTKLNVKGRISAVNLCIENEIV